MGESEIEQKKDEGRQVKGRGASLPFPAVELGFWAVLSVLSPPRENAESSQVKSDSEPSLEADGGEEIRVDGELLRKITSRFGADPLPIIANGLALRREVMEGERTVSLSLDRYERTRAELAREIGSGTRAGQAAWPPGAQTIVTRVGHGSWTTAMHALGVQPQGPGRPRGTGRLTTEDFHEALRAFQADCERAHSKPTYAAYCRWVGEEKVAGHSRPSGPTVRQRYGTWRTALEEIAASEE